MSASAEWLLTQPSRASTEVPPVVSTLEKHPSHDMLNTKLGPDGKGDAGDVALPPISTRDEYDEAMLERFAHVPMNHFHETVLKAVVILKRRAQAARLSKDAKDGKEAAASAEADTDAESDTNTGGGGDPGVRSNSRWSMKKSSMTVAQPKKSERIKHIRSREEKILDGKQRLLERLEAHQLDDVQMVDDGNCQFRALSEQCYGTPKYHFALRLRTVEHMEENHADFEPYFAESEFSEYCRKMKMRGTWGDELSLRAASELLQCTIYVVTSEEDNWFLNYSPEKGGGLFGDSPPQPKRSLFLTDVSPIHYNTCEPQKVSKGRLKLIKRVGAPGPQP
eukprot:FR739258.1.p1 GENE.FR739258.1~~FR739258.1.p1  ORF type:complete len:336 (+),score=41.88 FR739258.1:1-1008(+)